MRLSHLFAGALAMSVVTAGVQAQEDRRQREEERQRREEERSARERDRERSREDMQSRLRNVIVQATGQNDDRGYLGISTSSSGRRDTLGLLVTDVTADGPADRAGLQEGDRIISINGTSLRINEDDAGEPDMSGVTTRRLVRELSRTKPGDEVELRVYSSGSARTMRVKLAALEDIQQTQRSKTSSKADEEERAVIGVSVEATGSRRDSLGVMITRIADDGPADRAGLVEGDRIAEVNGVSLRVSGDDAGDDFIANAKANRLTRELRNVKPGDEVELRVWSDGRFRTVRLRAERARDVYKSNGRGQVFFFNPGRVGEFSPVPSTPPMPPMARVAPMPPMPPMSPMPSMAPRAFAIPRVQVTPRVQVAPRVVVPRVWGGRIIANADTMDDDATRAALDEAVRGLEQAQRELEVTRGNLDQRQLEGERAKLMELRRSLEQQQVEMQRRVRDQSVYSTRIDAPATAQGWAQGFGKGSGKGWESFEGAKVYGLKGRGSATAIGDDYTLEYEGLRVTAVSDELAGYFGDESRDGALVLDPGPFDDLRAGDVILKINGDPIREGNRTTLSFRDGTNTVQVLRKGKRVEVEVEK